MLLLSYDGSRDSQAAANHAAAARFFAGRPVTILPLWEPLIDVAEVDLDAIPLGTRGRVG